MHGLDAHSTMSAMQNTTSTAYLGKNLLIQIESQYIMTMVELKLVKRRVSNEVYGFTVKQKDWNIFSFILINIAICYYIT